MFRMLPISPTVRSKSKSSSAQILHTVHNKTESINHVLKQTVARQSKSLPEFVKLVKGVATGQFKELRSALCATGDSRLADTHQQYMVSKSAWFYLTMTQRSNIYKHYRNFVLRNERVVTTMDGTSSCIAPRTEKIWSMWTQDQQRTLTIKKPKH